MSELRYKKHHLFCLNFKEHVRSFIQDHELIHPDKKMAISVSGGVDSVALADVLGSFNQDFELIHFNHGTRPLENKKEEELVTKLADQLEVKVNIFHFNLSLDEKNFEEKARAERKKIYSDYIKRGYWVYTAHHIDDSFEWTLMQSFKQSHVKSTLGIPLFNRGIVRPFMCVSKKQILRYARAKNLSWLEDMSNHSDKFERNALRLSVTHQIHSKYPQALKHYVSRHNQLAMMNNLHHKCRQCDLSVIQEASGGALFVSEDLSLYKNEIKDAIHRFSKSARGEIDQEVNKLLSAHVEIMKNPAAFPFKGPLNLSGGVSAYLMRTHLLILGEKHRDFYQDFDLKLRDYISRKTQIPELSASLSFPLLAIDPRKKLKKSSKFMHPLLPVTCEWLKNHGISYTFTPLLSARDRQMLAKAALILDSSVLGL
ncbi:tRNA lysidine(34) synthetase TilS [Bacteriovorax stolpii]|uniref:tRNA lysidine(34) synthetase TilS n=1 Tax=Bacteriovorax stolpii TaxID=960 RepID=UPI00115B1719|nr:tRNA lysidine(34) synthetase TilS [Bacteriovorax stolpii]QDK41665.1 tRNA lysidine(34) synthetase TilS [Bacteriovorax stolpii]